MSRQPPARRGPTGLVVLVFLIFLLGVSNARAEISLHATAHVASGAPLDALNLGDEITIDVVARNDGALIFGIGLSAVGYDESVVDFVSGVALGSVFNAFCLPSDLCLGGAFNETGVPTTGPAGYSARRLVEEQTPLGPKVPLIQGVYGSATQNTGVADVGVVTGNVGEAQFQLIFRVTGLGSTVIDLGGFRAYGDGVVGSGGQLGVVNPVRFGVTFVPEPSTALLLGLGLAGLSVGRSRRPAGRERAATR